MLQLPSHGNKLHDLKTASNFLPCFISPLITALHWWVDKLWRFSSFFSWFHSTITFSELEFNWSSTFLVLLWVSLFGWKHERWLGIQQKVLPPSRIGCCQWDCDSRSRFAGFQPHSFHCTYQTSYRPDSLLSLHFCSYRISPTMRGEIGPGSKKGPSSRLSLEAAVSLFKPQCSSTPGNRTHNLQSVPKRDISSNEWINLKAAITWFQQREWKYKWQHLLIQSHSFWWSGPVCYLLVQSSFSSVQSSEDYCVPFVLFIKFFHNLRTPCSLDPGERARSSARLLLSAIILAPSRFYDAPKIEWHFSTVCSVKCT